MNYDVAVVGGGMVGLTLACALGQGGLRVAVIEARQPPPVPREPIPDLRVSAIAPASRRVLEACGVWSRLPAERLGPYREMCVWDAGGDGSVHFDCADVSEPALGWIVENAAIQTALERRIGEIDSIKWYRPSTLRTLEIEDQQVSLRLEQARLRTRLLAGADGSASRVRTLVGLPAAIGDYGQHAVVGTVHTELPHAETAWQRFLPTGPLAFLPAFGGYSSIVWSTTPELAEELLGLDDGEFGLRLTEAFEQRLGQVRCAGPRAAFPLRRVNARRYVSHRVALLGDAAHTIHPLAGQGVNLGLLDAAALAECVLDALAAGRDPGGTQGLRRYERWRKAHNVLVLGAMDAFKELFGPRPAPVRALRSLGLRMVDRAPPLKQLFMERAMGLAGDLPAMARGEGPLRARSGANSRD